METVRDFITVGDTDRNAEHSTGPGAARAGRPGMDGVGEALALLKEVSLTAAGDAARLGFRAASDFAGTVEEVARIVEYLQLVAAASVDQTRRQTTAAAARTGSSWTTGWRDDSRDGSDSTLAGPGDTAVAEPAMTTAAANTSWTTGWRDDSRDGSDSTLAGPGDTAAVDDGYRNTTEFLRARLRISAAEARRRLSLAGDLLPRRGFTGEPLPPVRGELGSAVAAGEVASRAATIITLALDRIRHTCQPDDAARMEHALTRTAAENDTDFLARVARSWTDALDQDGAEPSEELLRQLQGAFIRKPRHGLQHLEIFATGEQFEHLLTVMNTATNPRISTSESPAAAAAAETATASGVPAGAAACAASAGTATGSVQSWHPAGASSAADVSDPCSRPAAADGWAAGASDAGGTEDDERGAACLDLRTRPQKRLDGLVGACKAGLAAGALPAAGGLRPQVMVTIDHRDLLGRLGQTDADADADWRGRLGQTDADADADWRGRPADGHGRDDDAAAGQDAAAAGSFRSGQPTEHTGNLLFTGPVTASTVRKIACDADIIPVLLAGDSRILDIGRASRVFPPHIRKALTARDQGCAFPGCTIPAPWCEAHHITYWSRGGTTGTDNGVLLCSHHHHLIHKEQWTIQLRTGVPWFIPPPHIDPRQKPRRNYYFRPTDLGTATRRQPPRKRLSTEVRRPRC